MVVFKIKIKSILKGIRKIKPLKLIVGGAKKLPGIGSVVAEGERLYSAARSKGGSVAGSLVTTAKGLEGDVAAQNQVQGATSMATIAMIIAAVVILFLLMRGRR